MDTEPNLPRQEPADATSDRHADGAAKVSGIIGSEEFVERVRQAMTIGVRRAMEENAALQRRTDKLKS